MTTSIPVREGEPSLASPDRSGLCAVSSPTPTPAPRADLLRRLAHELRGPAGVGSQAVQELELALAAGRPTEALLAMIRRSSKRFVRLADRLSMVSEIERGAARFERVMVDVREVAKGAAQEAVDLLARRKVDVTFQLGDAPAKAEADPKWLGAALMEICNNAIRFAKSAVVVRVAREGDEMAVTVQDDGPGFGDHDPFQSTLPNASGLGLSLMMVRDIVAAHGGRLSIGRAGPLGGAVVTIALPAPAASVAARPTR